MQSAAGISLMEEKRLAGPKKMKLKETGFKIEPPKYKGNAVLNANRS